jgi:DNA-binding NarL/FixJ family response regulator
MDIGGVNTMHPATDWALTDRELLIIDDLLHGWPNRAIAQHLGVRNQTITNQLTALYRKAGVSGRGELVLLAVKRGVTKIRA